MFPFDKVYVFCYSVSLFSVKRFYCAYWFSNVLSEKSVARAFVQWLLLAG
jgi:hypothetical protein